MCVCVHGHLPLLIQVEEKVNLNGRPPQHTGVGKGVRQTGQEWPWVRNTWPTHQQSLPVPRKDWEEVWGEIRGQNDCPISVWLP